MNIILDNGAFKPEFAHKTDAGADLRSPIEAVDRMIELLQRTKELWESEERQNE